MNNLNNDEYTIDELINGIKEINESIIDEINQRYLSEYGAEPACFISSDHQEHWDYISQQREEEIDAVKYAEKKEIEEVLDEQMRVRLISEEISQPRLEDILNNLTNPADLLEAVKKDDFCILSRNGGHYEFHSNLEDLLTIDHPISAVISWEEFRPGIEGFDRIKEYSEDQIGSLYRVDESKVRIPLYLTNIKKAELLELVASYIEKTEDEIMDEFEDVNIFKDNENNSAVISFNGNVYPFIFEKYDYFKFDTKQELPKNLNTGFGICELFIDTLKYNMISPSEITADLVGKFYDFIFDWVIKNKIKLENIATHTEIEPELCYSLHSEFATALMESSSE